MNQPFADLDTSEWRAKRDTLIDDYPLDLDQIRGLVLRSFDKLLETRIGDPQDDIKIYDDVPLGAQTTGAFLETIIAHELRKMDSAWRQGSEAEKDLIHTKDPEYSTEVKLSGQVDDKIFGNRSFAQETDSDGKKAKSGYYIVLNVHISDDQLPPSHRVFLIRFGWIDHSDWTGQASETGHSARLSSDVYEHKLRVIDGDYLCDAPLELVSMIGEATIESVRPWLDEHEVTTVGEFLDAYESVSDPDSDLERVYARCKGYPENTVTME